jgi:coenzyme F420-reducing hydrogenase alpha subunit
MCAQAIDPEIQAIHERDHSPVVSMRFSNGEVKTFQVAPVQSPRRFEQLLRGRPWRETALIAASASGSSSVAHQMASLKATEDALDIEVTEQTTLLRKLMLCGSHLSQNLIHLFYSTTPEALQLPEAECFVGPPSELDTLITRARKIADDVCDAVGGRITYPMTCVPGGFASLPAPYKLKEIQKRIKKEMLPTLAHLTELFAKAQGRFPVLEREREFISLASADDYPLYSGRVTSSDGRMLTVYDYEQLAEQSLRRIRGQNGNGNGSGKKREEEANGHWRKRYMVGPLARVNNNHDMLTERALAAAGELGLGPICHNPYWNSIAQIVECLQCADKAHEIIEALLDKGLAKQEPGVPRRMAHETRGIGCTEACNGLVFHDYTFDPNGSVVSARCVSPINQNLPAVADDLRMLSMRLQRQGMKPAEIAFWLEVLVRSCDPTITYQSSPPADATRH